MPFNATIDPRPEAVLTLQISTIVTWVATGFWGLVAIVELWGLTEACQTYSRLKRSKINWEVFELRVLLFLQIITYFGLLAIEGMTKALVPFPTDQLDCNALAIMNG